jgi:hypothetical protein
MSRERARQKPRSFSEKFWDDKQGNFVVWQKPNIWLWTWIVTLVIGWFIPYGGFEKFVGLISLIALAIWAILEVYSGVNYFRRTLGVLVLLMLILAHI